MVEQADFEWERHKPSWGAIPEARHDHFAFVYNKKMFIVGGTLQGANNSITKAFDIPYLDLTSWTWGVQKTTGNPPPNAIQSSSFAFDVQGAAVRAVTGLKWESGAQQAMDVYALDLASMVWTMNSIRGRWNINWKPEATVYSSTKSKILQFGRHPLTNFSDQMVLNNCHLPTLTVGGQASIFTDLMSPDRESNVTGLYELSSGNIIALYNAPSRGFSAFGSLFSWTAMNGKLEASLSVGINPAEFVGTVQVKDSILVFDMSSLSQDRVAIIDTKTITLGTSSVSRPLSISPEMRFAKASARAPQRPRVGASIVYYDGYIIFFGGLTDPIAQKSTNELSVLSIGSHHSVESILDDLQVADELLASGDEDLLSAEVDAIEISSTKKKKKKPSKSVKFEEDDADLQQNGGKNKPKDPLAEPSSSDTTETSKKKDISEEEDQEDDEKEKDKATIDLDEEETAARIAKEEQELLDSVLAAALAAEDAEKTGVSLPTNVESGKADESAKTAPPSVEKDPAGALEHWLVTNQANTLKLLGLAVNNPDCFPDMAFKVGGKTFWAHKAIICARSSRWRQQLEGENKKKTASPSTGRRGDLEDSQLDVSTESAMPPMPKQGSGVISPFMFSRLGSGAIDLMLEEDEKVTKHEMVTLPVRLASLASRPEFGAPNPPPSHVPPPPNAKTPLIEIAVTTTSSPSSSSDSVISVASSSGIAPPAKSVPIYTLEDDVDPDAFLKVLKFMYTGQISIYPHEAEYVGDVAHEFLLDEVSAICREGSLERSYSEPLLKLSRMLRRLVGSNVGSDYFFVVRRKKLFAHRFLIMLFSSHFRTLMNARPDKAYVEIRELDDLNVTVETFIDFCRMLYSNFGTLPEHAEKKVDVAAMTRLSAEWGEYRCLALMSSVKPDASSTLDLFRLASANKFLLRDVRRRILMNFGKFVQDKKVIQSLTRAEQVSWRYLGELAGASLLDKMWFAHAIGDQKQLADVEKELGTLINVENVLPVLFGAHQAGLKGLRSLCMDFMTAHSTSIEDARRMQADAPLALGKVAGLSASLNNELTSKLSSATASSGPAQKVKRCAHCTKTFPTFGKKTNCALCHKITCSDCTKKKSSIPPIFGFSKPRDVCVSCAQVVDLWADPAAKAN